MKTDSPAWVRRVGADERKAWRILGQLVSYSWIGCIGFAIEAIILTALATLAGVNIYISRLISFTCATAVTWYLNGRFTFRSRGERDTASRAHEYGRYLLVQIVGAAVNLVVFTFLVMWFPALHEVPVVPLAVGAAFGLLVNFTGARLWVYRV
jgi:putative flippase GtrA